MKQLVVIPTYNEKENIEKILREVFSLVSPFEVLVIDDNSPDGTADIVQHLQKEFSDRLYLIQREGKLGLGTAYLAGFKWALERDYEAIFEMDADFSHPPKDLLMLSDALKTHDMSIGSRYITGINVVNWPLSRVLMSYFASKYVQLITGLSVTDTTAGFVGYRREVLETINLSKIKMKGYGFQIEMKFAVHSCQFKIKEVPIIFINRELGESKMHGGIFSEAVWGVIRMVIRSWYQNYKRAAISKK